MTGLPAALSRSIGSVLKNRKGRWQIFMLDSYFLQLYWKYTRIVARRRS
jgi:hypothetical protein